MEFEKIAYVLVLVLIAPFLRGLARDILKKIRRGVPWA